MSDQARNDHDWKPRHNPWAIAMVVTLATFMEVLDTSVANVSLPHIAGNLSVTEDEATWVLTSYLVANAVVLPLSGWLATLFGRKRFYMLCVTLFTVSSFLCGFAPNLPLLIFFRVLQGVGGGGLQPSEQAILADTFEPKKRGMAFAIYGMAVVLAPAIGPTLGGWITDNYSWRWIFYINVPVGFLSLILSARLVEDPPWARKKSGAASRIDYIGLSLIVIGISCLQYVLDKGEREDWFGSSLITGVALTSAACLVGAVVWALRAKDPVIEVRMFKNRNFAVSTVMMFTLGVVLFGSTVLLPQYLQTLMGYTARQAGEVLSPGGLVVIALLPLVGRLMTKVDARWLVGFGFLETALALLYMASHLHPGIDFATATKLRMIQSIGLPFLFIPISTMSYVGVAPDKNNQVSAMTNFARNLGGGVGISLATTLIARRAQLHRTRLVEHLSSFSPAFRRAGAGLSHALSPGLSSGMDAGPGPMQKALGALAGGLTREAVALSYIDVIRVLAWVCLGLLPLVLVLRKNKPGAATMAH